MIYKSLSGHSFIFDGWSANYSPLELFDRNDYLNCLHGILLGLTLINNERVSHQSLSDEGVIHELLHLALSIDICTENTRDSLRLEIKEIQENIMEIVRKYDNS